MKKNLFILAACLLPATLCAQSALHQLESLAGMSIHDVPVPAVPDPTPVYADDEEETESPQSTHLKDYTPAQEQETPDEKRKREILEETQRREAQIHRQVQEESRRKQEQDYKEWNSREERISREHKSYQDFLKSNPQVQPVPLFSSIDEHKVLFPEPKSPAELYEYGNNFKLPKDDPTFKADMIVFSSRHSLPAYFLGKRLPNGRVEWRMFIYELGEYAEDHYLCGFFHGFDSHNIKDVRMYGEGRVIILDMYDGTSYVTNPHGSLICHGTNISFPAMCGDVLFIECDGELYASNAPTAASQAILTGAHFDYYRNSIIVTNYYDGKPSYRLCSYGGRKYDYVENTWSRFSADVSYEYIAPFFNDGEYFVLKPYKKDYIIVSYCGGKLYRGKKKYKSLEAAHAGWSKEQQYIWNLHESNPDKCAQNKD